MFFPVISARLWSLLAKIAWLVLFPARKPYCVFIYPLLPSLIYRYTPLKARRLPNFMKEISCWTTISELHSKATFNPTWIWSSLGPTLATSMGFFLLKSETTRRHLGCRLCAAQVVAGRSRAWSCLKSLKAKDTLPMSRLSASQKIYTSGCLESTSTGPMKQSFWSYHDVQDLKRIVHNNFRHSVDSVSIVASVFALPSAMSPPIIHACMHRSLDACKHGSLDATARMSLVSKKMFAVLIRCPSWRCFPSNQKKTPKLWVKHRFFAKTQLHGDLYSSLSQSKREKPWRNMLDTFKLSLCTQQ